MGKKSSNQSVKKSKLFLTFNEDARKEYLTGFRKRKQERKAKAQSMLEKKLKDKIKQERKKRRKSTQEKVNKLLAGITLPGDNDDNIEETETVDFGTHEAVVKTCIDYGETGLFLAPSQHDEQVADISPSGEESTTRDKTLEKEKNVRKEKRVKKDKKVKLLENTKNRKKKYKQKR